ncbi:MAG: DegQ family serine endoprotease, partial [Burkholderiales bacterium]
MPTMNSRVKPLFLSILMLSLLGCSPATDNKPAGKAAEPASSAPTTGGAPRVGVTLPDFTTLVEQRGSAVVNISTTQMVTQRNAHGGMPGVPDDDPLNEFFKRFMPPQHPRPYQTQSLGSGFIISPDGIILTNAHVVADADEVTVRLSDKRELKAKVLGSDKRTDVAVIRINAENLPTVPLGEPSQLKVGEWVVAIGSPFGFDSSVTAGIVSAKGRSLPDENYVPFLQTDVPINPGNSGGPLFNMRGEVVGINSQIYSRSGGYMGISFAIPIDVAMNVAKQLQQSGKVSRGRIGVQIQPLTQELAQSFGLKSTEGALVSQVEGNGPAAKAGLQAGDVILKFNNQTVKSSNELPLIVANVQPGSKVPLALWRKGKEVNLSITVGEMPSERVASEQPAEPQVAKIQRLGLNVSDLDAQEKAELGLRGGVLVEGAEGEAAKAGI